MKVIPYPMNTPALTALASLLLVVGCADKIATTSSPEASPPVGEIKNGIPTLLISEGVPVMLQFYKDAGSIEFSPECRAKFESLIQQYGCSDLDEIESFGRQLQAEVVRSGVASEIAAELLRHDYESYVIFRGNGFRPD